MERVLEGAVEHGLTITRDRVQALAQAPADLLVSENAHARGFRLEGYGVFFDVVVPSFETTWTWSLRTLDQNDLGVESALRTLQSHVRTEKDPDLEQALKRLELQMGPAVQLYTAFHPLDRQTRTAGLEYANPIRIGDGVWIGGGAIVLAGVTIGDGSVIGAGSVVRHDVPAGVVAAGNPARIIRTLG